MWLIPSLSNTKAEFVKMEISVVMATVDFECMDQYNIFARVIHAGLLLGCTVVVLLLLFYIFSPLARIFFHTFSSSLHHRLMNVYASFSFSFSERLCAKDD